MSVLADMHKRTQPMNTAHIRKTMGGLLGEDIETAFSMLLQAAYTNPTSLMSTEYQRSCAVLWIALAFDDPQQALSSFKKFVAKASRFASEAASKEEEPSL